MSGGVPLKALGPSCLQQNPNGFSLYLKTHAIHVPMDDDGTQRRFVFTSIEIF
jgi:hypothetical protein